MDRAPQRQHRASQGKRPMALQAGGKDLPGGSEERERLEESGQEARRRRTRQERRREMDWQGTQASLDGK